MKKIISNGVGFLLLSFVLLVSGCSKERLVGGADGGAGEPVAISLRVNAASGAANNETDINRLRMVIFGSLGSSDAGRLILNKYYATVPAGNSLNEIITSGKRDVYVIVNEPLSAGGVELVSYKNIATVGDIRKLTLDYQGKGLDAIYTPSEICMFKEYVNQTIAVDSPNNIGNLEVERTMAKVTVKLNVNHGGTFPAGKHVVVDNIVIGNLPDKSYMIAQPYSDALFTSERQIATAVTAGAGYNFSSSNVFYVPEYLLGALDKGAYIDITGHVNGEALRVTTWRVKLGDAMDDMTAYGDRYDITRNRHYIFTGDVKGYGAMDGLSIKVSVLPWNRVDLTDAVGRFVAYTKTTDALGRVINDGGVIEESATTLKVTCNTNIGGWYTVTRDANGVVVNTSAPTSAVTTAVDQIVTILSFKLSGVYTVNIYQPAIAAEAVGPVKSFKFMQKGGFIPNSLLIHPQWPHDVWPLDRLPPTGLHLAKRGFKVLPDGVAGDINSDPKMQWKTDKTTTDGVERVTAYNGSDAKLGWGKIGTDVMTKTAALRALHPAAAYCREMGPEWYLPSIAELQLIEANEHLLGSSYTFTDDNYWGATESNGLDSWGMFYRTGLFYTGHRTLSYRVRCVKNI